MKILAFEHFLRLTEQKIRPSCSRPSCSRPSCSRPSEVGRATSNMQVAKLSRRICGLSLRLQAKLVNDKIRQTVNAL